MQQGDEHRPFEDPDSGLILGEPSPFQYVPPPLPSNKPLEDSGDGATTQPIQLPVRSEAIDASEKSILPKPYAFRRHWREPFLRLVPSLYVVKAYLVLYVLGGLLFGLSLYVMYQQELLDRLWVLVVLVGILIPADVWLVYSWMHSSHKWLQWLLRFRVLVLATCFVAASAVSFSASWLLYRVLFSDSFGSLLLLGVGAGLLLLVFPLFREVYRWRARTVRIEHTKHGGIRIIYGEPDNIFLLFNGDGNENVTKLEGSAEFNLKISWPNKLLFWWCGNLVILGKIEGGSPLIVNVPRIKRVRDFLNNRND